MKKATDYFVVTWFLSPLTSIYYDTFSPVAIIMYKRYLERENN